MGWWLVLAVLLYLACAALIIAEIYVPSGGLISIFAMACLIGGVAVFFHNSNLAGVAGIGVAIVMIPSVLIIAYKVFSKTRFVRSGRGRSG